MSNDIEYGLIGSLFYKAFPDNSFEKMKDHYINKKDYIHLTSVEYFQKVWLGIKYPTNRNPWTSLSRYDTFESNYQKEIQDYVDNKGDSSDYETIIRDELKQLGHINKINVLNALVSALVKVTAYGTSRKYKNTMLYDAEVKERLISHINKVKILDPDSIDLPRIIRLYLLFAVKNYVPVDFSETDRIKKDYEEFTEKVTKRYGMTNKHAIREIYNLAHRAQPNIVAMYEYADMLYFGQVEGIESNLKGAFALYKAAAGINNMNSTSESSDAYPLALWSLAYIYLNYQNSKLNLPLSEHEIIDEIQELTYLDRIKKAYHFASQAYTISGLPAAANTLGQIAQLTDEDPDCQGIDEFKKEKKMKKCTVYFNMALNGGYIYANNMLAKEELRLLSLSWDDIDSRKKHINKYIGNLHESATRHETYAANKLGRIYLEGKTRDYRDTRDLNFDDIVDYDKAYNYFMLAYKTNCVFYDINCAWACAHLYKFYFDRLIEDDLEDIYRILEKFKHKTGIMMLAFDQSYMLTKEQFMTRTRKSL